MEKYLSATPQATVLITILTMAFLINALVYFYRLVCSLFQLFCDLTCKENRPHKYGGLWKLPYCMLLMLGIHPPHTFSYPMLGICLILWIFAVVCAILQSKVMSRLTWRRWGDEKAMWFIQGSILICQQVRKGLLWLRKKWEKLAATARVGIGLLCVGLLIVAFLWIPNMIVPLAIPFLLGFILLRLWLAMSSCRVLLEIWFVEGLTFALMAASAIWKIIPNEIANVGIAYAVFCILFAFAWCATAGIADYDVAKLACSVVNTGTTIAMLFVNIFFRWLSENSPSFIRLLCELNRRLEDSSGHIGVEDIVYGFNCILFPLVAAGFIAALFVEGRQYILKRMDIPDEDTRN